MTQRAECLSDAAVTYNQQFGPGQDWLDENLHLSSARHTHSQLLVPQVKGNDLWFGRRHAPECFGLDRAFGTTTAHPSDDQFAVLVDQAFRPSRSRGRSLNAHHGCDSERSAVGAEFCG